MSDEKDRKEDPAEELKQGLTHLWRAARGAAAGVKKEVERTDIGKAVDDAGRELVRAAASVVNRIADEVTDLTSAKKPGDAQHGAPPAEKKSDESHEHEEDEFDGVKPKAKDPGAQEPGVRIAVDEDEKKKGG